MPPDRRGRLAETTADRTLFAALADATRLQVLRLLSARGQATASQLATDLPVSRQAIVKHLVVLDRAGLVDRHMHGCEARYAVQPAPLRAMARQLETIAAEWDRRLTRLKALAEEPSPQRRVR